MRTSFILLSGAAALALLGGASTTPVYAQYAGNPPQYSTPAEQAQTQQLNEQAINGTDQTPAELNGETNPPYNPRNYPSTNSPTYGTYGGYSSGQPATEGVNPDDSASPYHGTPPNSSNYTNPGYPNYGSPNYSGYPSAPPQGQYGGENDQDEQPQNAPPPNYQQQQYNQQMQQYQDQQQDYQNQRDQYDRQRARYDRNIRWYDQTRWAYVYPAAVVYRFDAPRMLRVDMISEPSQQLADVPIEGPNGEWVGRIRNVETAPDGRAGRVEVALNRRVSVWVSPRRFRFDPRDRVAFTNLTREDLWNMPGATVESYPM